MFRPGTPCSSSQNSVTRVTSPVDKENLRRQIVGLAFKRDSETARTKDLTSKKKILAPSTHINIEPVSTNVSNDFIKNRRIRLFPPGVVDSTGNKMPHVESQDAFRNTMRRSKTTLNFSIDNNIKQKPKIVRFRMDEVTIGKQKAPIVNISDNSEPGAHLRDNKASVSQGYEVRGNAIALKKEGLKGLLAYKDLCTDHERRQNNLQTSLKLFRRRIKLNQEKFIQPNETTTEDYVIHPRSPFGDVQTNTPMEDTPISRPGSSSNEHVRILRSALHCKHNGGTVVKQTDTIDTSENIKNIKCSYRLPENLNWGKEVSFKDIKDDAIPNVKTYVLEEDSATHVKFRKTNHENAVTLNTHNLNVHNSITQINGQKVKLGDSEVSFDPRFIDWIEDSYSHIKMFKNSTFMSEDTLECPAPVMKRRVSIKS